MIINYKGELPSPPCLGFLFLFFIFPSKFKCRCSDINFDFFFSKKYNYYFSEHQYQLIDVLLISDISDD